MFLSRGLQRCHLCSSRAVPTYRHPCARPLTSPASFSVVARHPLCRVRGLLRDASLLHRVERLTFLAAVASIDGRRFLPRLPFRVPSLPSTYAPQTNRRRRCNESASRASENDRNDDTGIRRRHPQVSVREWAPVRRRLFTTLQLRRAHSLRRCATISGSRISTACSLADSYAADYTAVRPKAPVDLGTRPNDIHACGNIPKLPVRVLRKDRSLDGVSSARAHGRDRLHPLSSLCLLRCCSD